MRPLAAHIDFETRSTTNLVKAGLHRYAEDPNTGVWGFSWKIGGGLLRQWRPGYPDPVELLHHIANGGHVVSHNAAFERMMWNVVVRVRFGLRHWPELQIEQQSCTMARAAALAYPGKLEKLAEVIGTVNQKDMEGSKLMMKMCVPRKVHPDGRVEWWDLPEYIDRQELYQDQDVRVEDEIDGLLPHLTAYEQRVWELDQRINDRGVYVDEAAVIRAVDVVLEAKRDADKRMRALTDGAVKKCTEITKIVQWIASRGMPIEKLAKGDQDEVIAMSAFYGDDTIRKVVQLRKEASKTSVAKYGKMLDCMCSDSRIRGLLEYCGARRTGRWSGRLVQPQNLPRVQEEDGAMVEYTASILSMSLSSKDACDMITMAGFDPLPALSKSLRAMFRAAPGHRLIGGDFSNVEGRINAWLAGEEWKLEAFRAYDAGTGEDLYKLAYAKSFGVDVATVGKGQKRQIGKVQELACGYQGAVGAYITMGDTYGVKPYDLVNPVFETTSPMIWDAMAKRYEKAQDKFGLPEDQWVAIKLIVTNWRAAHPNIVQSWWDLGDAAIEAVDHPNVPVPVYGGRVRYLCTGNWLYCQLPSGRVICYSNPWVKESTQTLVNKNGEEYERVKRTVWFVGLNGVTKQWEPMYLYGGHQCENIVQSTARCLMDHAMFRVEDAGYPLVLTVHDELLAEVQHNLGSVHEFKHLMSISPEWGTGLPIAAAAWEDERYVK